MQSPFTRAAFPAQPPFPVATGPAPWVSLDMLPHMLCIVDGEGAATYANAAWRDFAGAPAAMHWMDAIHSDDAPLARLLWNQARHGAAAFEGEYRLRHRSGAYRWAFLAARPHGAGAAGLWYLSGTDVHERMQAQHELAARVGIKQHMLDISADCIKLLRTDGTLIHMNKAGCDALGVPPDSGFGQRWLQLLPREVRAKGRRAIRQALRGECGRFPGMSAMPGEPTQYWDNMLTPVKDASGSVTQILCVSRNVTRQREAEQQLRAVSETDALTGLPNRRALNTHLKRTLARARSGNQQVGLMLIDLDHFKHVNDTLGHPAGDRLLTVLSRRLRHCLPPHGFIARLGGDEFAIVLAPLAGSDELEAVARCVRGQTQVPITFGGKAMESGMSIGCATYPRDAQDPSGLMKCADTALNALKSEERGGIRAYSVQMFQAAERLRSELSLGRKIAADGCVQPHYQPKERLRDQRLVGFEALLRWRGADGAWNAPAPMGASFGDYEIATRIGEVMRARVLADMARWLRQGLPLVPVAINVAPVEFLRGDFARRLLREARQARVPPRLLEIEVPEHLLGGRGEDCATQALRTLRAHGVRVALDDFGTGRAALAHLRAYPVDCIKIDRSFAARVTEDPAQHALVKAIAQLGASLHLDVAAEGVEAALQSQALHEAGCTIGQGYLFGHAHDAAAAARMLSEATA